MKDVWASFPKDSLEALSKDMTYSYYHFLKTDLSFKHGNMKHYLEKKLLAGELKLYTLLTLLVGKEKCSFPKVFH